LIVSSINTFAPRLHNANDLSEWGEIAALFRRRSIKSILFSTALTGRLVRFASAADVSPFSQPKELNESLKII
jgi:hypothetical protein